jgi:hypothetical protein
MNHSIGQIYWAKRLTFNPYRERSCYLQAGGYILAENNGLEPQCTIHEIACLINTSDCEAQVEIKIVFSKEETVGPCRVVVPAQGTLNVRFKEMTDTEPFAHDTDYIITIKSDVPIVVQPICLESRQAENILLSSMADVIRD